MWYLYSYFGVVWGRGGRASRSQEYDTLSQRVRTLYNASHLMSVVTIRADYSRIAFRSEFGFLCSSLDMGHTPRMLHISLLRDRSGIQKSAAPRSDSISARLWFRMRVPLWVPLHIQKLWLALPPVVLQIRLHSLDGQRSLLGRS